VQDQVELVEVNLVLEQGVAVATDLHKKFVFDKLGNLWVFESLQIIDSLQD
jgi:hypothetical protein